MIVRGEPLPERTILRDSPAATEEHPEDLPLDLAELAETVRRQREEEKRASGDGDGNGAGREDMTGGTDGGTESEETSGR